MRSRFLLLVALTLALVAVLGGVAYADTAADNAQCLTCHGASGSGSSLKVDFGAADVSYSACRTCHYKYKHFEHPGVPTPCVNCHINAQAGAPYYYADTTTSDGYFSDATYSSKTPAELHAIHVNGDWVATYPYFSLSVRAGCQNCHAGVACSACHTGAVSHGDHALPDYAGEGYLQATGTSTTTTLSTCADSSCHALAKAATADFVPACSTCHFTFDNHYDETAHTSVTVGCAGEGCHAVASGLMAVHTERDAAFTCGGCHSSIRTAVQDAITAGDTSCGACHGSVSGLGGHRDAHNATPPLRDATTLAPNYSYYTGSAGTAPTGDCAGCHTSNLVDEHLGLSLGVWVFYPRHDATGAPLTCGTCHDQPAGSAIQDAIAVGASACESCHTVHGPMQEVHASTFVDSPEVPCGDCHDANLATEHNGGYTSTAGLVGCDVCHDLYTGMTSGTVTGVATQMAISTANDTRCSACHTAYHTDSTAHDTSSSASLACGSCHAAGQTVIDVASASLHPTCATCHKSTRIGAISGHTAECASCHSAEGTDYHAAMDASHQYYDMGASCQSCHANTLPAEHEKYLGRYPEYTSTCALCHRNGTLDLTGKTAACSSCHEIHADIPVLHTATASDACVRCHKSADLRVLHGATMDASCVTCHNATFDLTGKTAECTTCHNATVSPFHGAMDGSHTFATMDAGCQQAGCHTKTLPEEHAKYLSRYPQYTDTCALCHLNAAFDVSTKTADCSTCHEIHGDIAAVHTATASSACVACHESADVRTLHGASPDASCGVCHNAPAGRIDWAKATIECTSCHGTLSPTDPNHYPLAAHAATTEAGCVQCHSADLKTEHFKSTVSPAVTCVSCHEGRVDAFTAPWDKTCTACHPTKHANQATAHKSTNTSCTGTGCHVVTDVSVLHRTNCAACHAAGVTASTNCVQCHAGTNPHHATITLNMSTSSQWATVCGSCHGRVHNRGSCLNCHSRDMHGESHHIERNANCAICHRVAAADASDNCLGCHTNLDSSSSGSWGGGSWGGGSWGTTTSGAVSGTITNSATGAVISGASVSVAGKTATSGYSGTYSISDVSAGTYTMTVTASGYQAWSGSVTVSSGSTLSKNVALSATAPTATNLARAGTASASSTNSYSYAASKAIDGDTNTYWRSASAGTQWLRVDLGSAKAISKVVVSWFDTRYARAYRVETSDDGSTWATQYSTASGSSGTQTITFATVNARYVRVYCTNANNYDYRISELQVWSY